MAPTTLTPPIVLTAGELEAITSRPRPSAQARVLTALGIPFKIHPYDRTLVVLRAAAEAALGGVATKAAVEFDVNLEALHGATTHSR